MRHLKFDQYEFDVPDSAQSLELTMASVRQHADLDGFLTVGSLGIGGNAPSESRGGSDGFHDRPSLALG